MKTYLFVPYEEKDEAKRLGARWDAEQKKWYVPDGLNVEPFSRWLDREVHTSADPTVDLLPSWVPDPCRGTKLSIFLTTEEQGTIKKKLYQQNQGCCSICHRRTGRLMLYPDWAYLWGEHPLQKLKTILLLCPDCHRVKYYGINRLNGLETAMIAHLTRVRGCTEQKARSIVNEREQLFFKFSSVEWDLDVSALADFGFPPNSVTVENEMRRRGKENGINPESLFVGLQEGWY